MAASRSTKNNQPSQSNAGLIFGMGVIGALVGTWFFLPGFTILWVASVAAALLEPPVQLTGPKKNGYPTPLNDMEAANLARSGVWKRLRLTLLVPIGSMPGWPILGIWFAGIACFLIGLAMPQQVPVSMSTTEAAMKQVPTWTAMMHLANAISAFVLPTAFYDANRRRWGHPGVRIDSLLALIKENPLVTIAKMVGAALLTVALLVVATRIGGPDVAEWAAKMDRLAGGKVIFVVGAATLAAGGAVWSDWSRKALDRWRLIEDAKAEWEPRWLGIKMDPAPTLVDREINEERGYVIDTFDAPMNIGAKKVIEMTPKLLPSTQAGHDLVILTHPLVKDKEPKPGTVDPIRFRAVTWDSMAFPDLTDPAIEMKVVELAAEFAMAKLTDSQSQERSLPMAFEAITTEDSEKAAYQSLWEGGMHVGAIRIGKLTSALAANLHTEALIDHRAMDGDGVLYFGALSGDSVEYTESGMKKELADIANEDWWVQVWNTGSPSRLSENVPTISVPVYAEATLADGTLVKRQPFVTRKGVSPQEYFGSEPKLAASLGAVPFVALTGWPGQGGRPGDRHPQALCVYWSTAPVPATIDALGPVEGGTVPLTDTGDRNARMSPRERRERRRPAGRMKPSATMATSWVVAGAFNKAFDASKLARPEVVSSYALSTMDSRRHLWKVQLRLHDGVTLDEVRAKAEKIRTTLGVPWLRVVDAPDGCIVVAGADPDHVTLVNPETDGAWLVSLDWEQAFLAAGTTGLGGMLPKLQNVERLEHNDQVQIIDFSLPQGLSADRIKAAIKKLKAATGNEFVELRPSPRGASAFRLLVSEVNPLPARAPFEFDTASSNRKFIYFATGVEGEPVGWEVKEMPHVLVAGVTGGGKECELTTKLPVPLSERFPTGWATVGELEVGDLVLGADGTAIKIIGLSPIENKQVHRVHFSDGQSIDVSGTHVWKVSTRLSRTSRAAGKTAKNSQANQKALAEAERLRALAATYPAGTLGTIDQIAAVAGVSGTPLRRLLHPELGLEMLIPTTKPARRYNVETFAQHAKKLFTPEQMAKLPQTGYLSNREITELLHDGTSTRHTRDRIKALLRNSKADCIDGTAYQTVLGYDTAEALLIYADDIEARADNRQPLEKLMTTAEMVAEGVHHANGATNFAIRLMDPADTPDVELPIDPYVLGAWLGDGSSGGSQIASAIAQLNAAGLLNHKHIPAVYKRASRAQRLALLQGLMDADGSILEGRKCELTLSDETLANDALELIRSLGIKASKSVGPAGYKDAEGNYVASKDRHRMVFTTDQPVFRLPRKLDKLPAVVRGTQDWNYITDIEVLDTEAPMRCLVVDHPEHLYAVEGFILTHNSVAAQNFLWGWAAHGDLVCVIDPMKQAADFQFLNDYAYGFAVDTFEAAAMLKAIYAEVRRRMAFNAQNKVGSYLDLPEEIRPKRILVFIDEFTSLMGKDVVPAESSDPEEIKERELVIAINGAKSTIGTFTGKIAREARSAGVHLALGTQKLTAKTLDTIPGAGDLKTNLGRMLLGNASLGDKQSALRAPLEAPDIDSFPPGRGLWEPLTRPSSMAIQTWFAPQNELAAELANRIDPIPEEEKLDFTPFLPKNDDDDDQFGPPPNWGQDDPFAGATLEVLPAGDETDPEEEEIELDFGDLDLDEFEILDDSTDEDEDPTAGDATQSATDDPGMVVFDNLDVEPEAEDEDPVEFTMLDQTTETPQAEEQDEEDLRFETIGAEPLEEQPETEDVDLADPEDDPYSYAAEPISVRPADLDLFAALAASQDDDDETSEDDQEDDEDVVDEADETIAAVAEEDPVPEDGDELDNPEPEETAESLQEPRSDEVAQEVTPELDDAQAGAQPRDEVETAPASESAPAAPVLSPLTVFDDDEDWLATPAPKAAEPDAPAVVAPVSFDDDEDNWLDRKPAPTPKVEPARKIASRKNPRNPDDPFAL